MHEIELKFIIPTNKQTATYQKITSRPVKTQRLSAYYFDTKDNQLAKQGIALRIRFEDEKWVQTLKTHGDGIAKRIELNTVLDRHDTPKTVDIHTLKPDLQHIDNPQVLAQLNQISPIETLNNALQIKYLTDIERTSQQLTHNDSQIEIAYDTGNIATEASNYAIHEIEFELVQGDVADLVAFTQEWCREFGLYLSSVTKAQRGGLLMANKAHADPVIATMPVMPVNTDLSQMVHQCLSHIVPNATAIADGSENSEHISQLCNGIDMLNRILTDNPAMIDPHWQITLQKTLQLLDNSGNMTQSQAIVQSTDFQLVILALISFCHK